MVLVLVLRPLPPPLQQRPLLPLLLPPLLLPLKPQRTLRFHGEPAPALRSGSVQLVFGRAGLREPPVQSRRPRCCI